MDISLLAASLLTLAMVLAHSIMGEVKVFMRMNPNDLPVVDGLPKMGETDAFTFQTLRFVWHVTSILGVALSVIMIYFSCLSELSPDERLILKVIAFAMLASGLLAMIISKGMHMGWIFFITIGMLCMAN